MQTANGRSCKWPLIFYTVQERTFLKGLCITKLLRRYIDVCGLIMDIKRWLNVKPSHTSHQSLCRNQVDVSKVENEKLLENVNNLANEKSVLIRESEETVRHLEHQYENKLK